MSAVSGWLVFQIAISVFMIAISVHRFRVRAESVHGCSDLGRGDGWFR
jgi:hypothetical protein